MSEVKDVYRDTCQSCGCEYLTTILYKPAFRDAEPQCPCCGGEGKAEEAPTEALVICDHAGAKCRHDCPHRRPHPVSGYCKISKCGVHAGASTLCVPVADGKEG